LIQETAFADSVIAHFGRSTAYWPTFATPSNPIADTSAATLVLGEQALKAASIGGLIRAAGC
jgi:hypothetical protein